MKNTKVQILLNRVEMLAKDLDVDATDLFEKMIGEYEYKYAPVVWDKMITEMGIDENSLDTLCAGLYE